MENGFENPKKLVANPIIASKTKKTLRMLMAQFWPVEVNHPKILKSKEGIMNNTPK